MRETCDRITVMYCGQAVESGPIATVFRSMRHPYTRGLFAAIPALGTDKNTRPLAAIAGQLPSAGALPSGCAFGPRCDYFVAGRCDGAAVAMHRVGCDAEHASRCLRIAEIDWSAPRSNDLRKSAGSFGAPILEVNELTKRYGQVVANDRLTFGARRGETVAIVGESGCGKSTFARS